MGKHFNVTPADSCTGCGLVVDETVTGRQRRDEFWDRVSEERAATGCPNQRSLACIESI